MDIRRKLSRAYGAGNGDNPPADKDQSNPPRKPVVKPVAWKAFEVGAAQPASPSRDSSSRDRTPATGGIASKPGLLKTVRGEEGTLKAAKFLLLIGKEEAASIMRHLEEEELLQISAAMAGIRSVGREEAEALMREFGFLKIPPRTSTGGVDVARALLTSAFGPDRAGGILKRVLPFGGDKPFAFLEEYEAHQIASLLKKESIRVVSVVLRFLTPRKSSAVLQALPVSQRVEALRRMGRMDKLDADALQRMQSALREKIRAQGKVVTQEVDGPAALASILRHLSLEHEEDLIRSLDEFNPELGREIKEKVFTLDLVLNIADRELQEVLRTHPDEEIARMLKGRDMRVREKILHNLSARRREMVEEEMLHMGGILKRDADASAREFLDYLMTLADQGVIHFTDREEMI